MLQALAWVYWFTVAITLRVPRVRSGLGVLLERPLTFTAGAVTAAGALLAAHLIHRRDWRGAALLAVLAALRIIAAVWTRGTQVGLSILIPIAGLVAGVLALAQLRARQRLNRARA